MIRLHSTPGAEVYSPGGGAEGGIVWSCGCLGSVRTVATINGLVGGELVDGVADGQMDRRVDGKVAGQTRGQAEGTTR